MKKIDVFDAVVDAVSTAGVDVVDSDTAGRLLVFSTNGGTQDRYTYIIAGDDGPTFATLSEARKYQERTGTALTAHTWTTNIQFLANHTED